MEREGIIERLEEWETGNGEEEEGRMGHGR